jgi:hypothetical protein
MMQWGNKMAESQITEIRRRLERIALGYGKCRICGELCAHYTECSCYRPTWEPCDPVEEAQAALKALDTLEGSR